MVSTDTPEIPISEKSAFVRSSPKLSAIVVNLSADYAPSSVPISALSTIAQSTS